jgi:nucleotide-binding universal stress UspA family protein
VDDDHTVMSTIVTAIDGSPSARAAVECAVAEACASGAGIEFVSAWSAPATGTLGGPAYVSEEMIYVERDAMREVLDEAKARAEEAGISAQTHLVAGDAAVEVCRLAYKRHAELIVMGSRGHKPLAAALLGSVAAHVVQHAHCPVMVVPARAA